MRDTSRISGRVRRIAGTVSTDDILPARYKHSTTDPDELAAHVFEYARPDLASTLRAGDILVGDQVFGIGSSREQAVSALKAAGVAAVLAPAFGRIFFRNAWNLGVPALEIVAPELAEGAEIAIDLDGGSCATAAGSAWFAPVPRALIEMVESGGLLARIAAGGGLPAA
jgi:3-isopropylmalate/(R)-2-methylmalate dehydratase small subunit